MQDFVVSPHFTQWSFFSAFGIVMLRAPIASAGDMCTRSTFDLWESIQDRPSSKTVTGLKYCGDFFDRCKNARSTQARLWSGELLLPSMTSLLAGQGCATKSLWDMGRSNSGTTTLTIQLLREVAVALPVHAREKGEEEPVVPSSKRMFFWPKFLFPLASRAPVWREIRVLRLFRRELWKVWDWQEPSWSSSCFHISDVP